MAARSLLLGSPLLYLALYNTNTIYHLFGAFCIPSIKHVSKFVYSPMR